MEKEYVIVSLCAFGVACRYHGKNMKMGHMLNKEKRTEELRKNYNILPLCGELMGGMPTPRPPCTIINNRVIGRINGEDYTNQYQKGANEGLRLAKIFHVRKAFLLRDSPMCGKGYGILAKLLEENGIKVYNI